METKKIEYNYSRMKNLTLKSESGKKIKVRKVIAQYVERLLSFGIGNRVLNRELFITAFNENGVLKMHECYLEQIRRAQKKLVFDAGNDKK